MRGKVLTAMPNGALSGDIVSASATPWSVMTKQHVGRYNEGMPKALAVGTLISLACFTLVFCAVSRFLPLFLRLADSHWSIVVVVLAVAGCPLIHLRKHRRKTSPAHR